MGVAQRFGERERGRDQVTRTGGVGCDRLCCAGRIDLVRVCRDFAATHHEGIQLRLVRYGNTTFRDVGICPDLVVPADIVGHWRGRSKQRVTGCIDQVVFQRPIHRFAFGRRHAEIRLQIADQSRGALRVAINHLQDEIARVGLGTVTGQLRNTAAGRTTGSGKDTGGGAVADVHTHVADSIVRHVTDRGTGHE